MLPDQYIPLESTEKIPGFVVAVLYPGATLDDLIAVLLKERLQCLNITEYHAATDYAELLEYGLTGASVPVGMLFLAGSAEYNVVTDVHELTAMQEQWVLQ